MERLAFGENSKYSALEASIHLNRYLSAKQFALGRDVLDIACGEGYGSFLLGQWGAKSVLGVDISEESISKAEEKFGSKSVRFIESPAESVLELVGGKKFDLIVSFETIEHVTNPIKFLENIKSLLSQNGILLLSCPNDYWYYEDGGSNPFHLHRWNAWEFRKFSENILGPALWAYGTFSIGFGTYVENGGLRILSDMDTQDAMMSFRSIENSLFTHMEADSAPSSDSVAYFLGIWGSSISFETYVGYPVSMNLTKYMQFKNKYVNSIDEALKEKDSLYENEHDLVVSLEKKLLCKDEELEKIRGELLGMNQLSITIRQQGIRGRILEEENELLRRRCGHLQWVSEEAEKKLSTVPWRIVRLWKKIRPLIPRFILNSALKSHRRLFDGRGSQ